ncbi:MAG: hypothetical protein M3463_05985, partial [Verrucomicrobiota bacterium]|nr:hypothetical protein [Verrucomicrobiota bacterium]
EKYYLPLGIKLTQPGRAGFCITGNSGGATQVGYALSHYGLDRILDVVIPSGGPPHSVLAKSMLEPDRGRQGYGYPESTRTYIDKSFGYFDKDGPGRRQDPAFKPRWEQESVATGGNDYHHPTTRIHFIFGDRDKGMQTVAKDYFDRLQKEGAPLVKWELAPNTNHGIAQTPAGLAALKAAILGVASPIAAEGQVAAPASPQPNTPPVVSRVEPDAKADTGEIDSERARALYQKSKRGAKLTPEEQAYLDKARHERRKPGRQLKPKGKKPDAGHAL